MLTLCEKSVVIVVNFVGVRAQLSGFSIINEVAGLRTVFSEGRIRKRRLNEQI